MKLLAIIFCICFSCGISWAQNLTIQLPAYAGKKTSITVFHGIRKDTIVDTSLNHKGEILISTSGLINNTSIAILNVNQELQYEFILSPKENIIIKSEKNQSNSLNIFQSEENNHLTRWYEQHLLLEKKIGLNKELGKLYTDGQFYQQLETERKDNESKLGELEDTLISSALFSAHFMRFSLALNGDLSKVWDSDSNRKITHNYFIHEIDFEKLHRSGLWFDVINSCIEVYIKDGPFYQQFGIDITNQLKKIKDSAAYEDLADAATSVCETFSWGYDQNIIIDFLIRDNRLNNPKGKLRKLLDIQKVRVGNAAPDLIITEFKKHDAHADTLQQYISLKDRKSQYSLLVFYQSGCGPCENTMQQLKGNYTFLTEKGIDIISISADTDFNVFKNTANTYPWKNKYYDLKGINGINFLNYGIIGTPTLMLVKNNGIIISKMATIQELFEEIKKIKP